ncbi:hypothetical protein COW36_10505 [bacterium (Candidatus Blackallbacteria) CG17_big_fil_post_rev_8_21_14_2_50_48_46]|uniref:Sporulation protein Cse60 n=1 Tax=bacterium (Candidatus Blackallbacteria) CG17_big_fil_post_rev_8_21_14_2_50_48_46 TaxID=2014261 RepID=A0A2M7G578_9BACT|nr:MAG: hypothetical protein COW64_20280 [bacterium (Candidatus Blackallbacteria) CG18_big_fil_WC_8_21_14_2_50_49_26]PIW17061.1 MAG: hypothetical protein COW36_10505 [bacterium (Candidatus Blackallbacteria) CG17_big_fil_post_rev_8_21_14_2_50_48_46]PIW47704.1 MAG: hypothetical protein COW20_11715 [bacterium (Candidatus Blackallbacteria) CG13_big_fil_rev_8_21_14_2_50_49_14]
MYQVRIFEAGDAEELQVALNEWFGEHPELEIVRITQSESAVADEDGDLCGNTTVSVFYKS